MIDGNGVLPCHKIQRTMCEKKIIKLRKVETTNRDENLIEEQRFLNAKAKIH
jgi:hypothetical protein